MIGHTMLPIGHSSSEQLFVPSWGFDLEYWFGHTWGMGIHSDIEIEQFVVETNKMEQIKRKYPKVVTLETLFRPWGHFVLQGGPGIEFEPERNLPLFRVGVEYEWTVGHDWDVFPTFFYDYRFDVYNTWTIGLGVGKHFKD